VYQIINELLIFDVSNKTKYFRINAERNIIQTNDDWSGIASNQNYQFLGIKSIEQMFYSDKDKNLLFSASIVQDQEKI
jgi:hypothetical protein